MNFSHLIIVFSISLFTLPSESLAECKELKPEIKMDENGNQLKHGLEVKCFPNGFMNWKGKWKNGKKDGKWTHWHENRKKSSEEHGTESRDSISHRKEEQLYKDGKRVAWTRWYNNGKKEFEKFWTEDGKEDGKWTFWYRGGQKKKEGTFKDGKPEWTGWHENGGKISRAASDGEKITRAASLSEKPRNPRYPRQAVAQKIEGRVLLLVEITRKGTTRNVKILKGLHPQLDELSVKYVKNMKWKPAIKDGKTVDSETKYIVNWKLE